MPIQHILLAILVAAIWGFNFIFVKLGVHEIPPLFLCAVRFLMVTIPAIFFIPRPTNSFRIVASYGLIMFALQFALIFTSLAVGMTAGMASLLLQTGVFFSILFAAVFNSEIPTAWQIAGSLLSFSGIGLAALHLDGSMTLGGFLLVLAGAAAMGLGNLITRRLGTINIATLVTWSSLIAFPPLLTLSFLVEGPARIVNSLHHFKGMALVSLLYIVYISTWVGYGAWSWLLCRYRVSLVVQFTLLVPVFGMLGSSLFLGEHFETWKMIVAGLVIAGLGINLLGPRLFAQKKEFNLAENG